MNGSLRPLISDHYGTLFRYIVYPFDRAGSQNALFIPIPSHSVRWRVSCTGHDLPLESSSQYYALAFRYTVPCADTGAGSLWAM